MNLTRLALSNPVAVIVAVLLVLLFGTISLFGLPVQMIPNVERPTISIQTGWRAAAPEEVESEIIEPQEDVLRGLPGLVKLESSASSGFGSINMTFDVNVDLQRALIEVMNRLNQVPNYPPDVTEPVIYAGRGQFGNAIAWFSLKPLPGQDIDITSYQDYTEEVVQARIERIAGVAKSDIYGGRNREVRITFDPFKAAAYNIGFSEVSALLGSNKDISGGFTDVGRRQYTVRYAGSYSAGSLPDMVITWRDGNPIRLRDIADVEIGLSDQQGSLNMNGGPAIALNAQPEINVNVLDVMDEIKRAVRELNEGPLNSAGLVMTQAYDESLYITQSISMLRNNLLLGILLAVGVLWWFFRKFRATLLVALAIPASLFFTFSMLGSTGRTLNIISLAGLAFSVGMVLDAAIVVLENIVRLREEGRDSADAAENGATQVWGALLASTTTTIAIFLPIVFLRDVAGQLFADLALAISFAVLGSLIIAITVIPTAANTALKNIRLDDPHKNWWDGGTALIMRLTNSRKQRLAWIISLILVAGTATWALFPDTDYLPEGRQNFIFGVILPPPGAAVGATQTEFVEVVNERMLPYVEGTADPAMRVYFLGIFGRFGFFGARAQDPGQVDALIGKFYSDVFAGFPDTWVFPSRAQIFGRLGGGRAIDMNIQSRDLDAALQAAAIGMGVAYQALPGAQLRPDPGLELAEPELRLIPDERRIAEAGWNRRIVASAVRALGDGLYVGDYFDGDKRLDVILRGPEWDDPAEFMQSPLVTPLGGVMSLSDLTQLVETAGPDQIRRVDRRRTITLRITPPADMPLGTAIEALREKVAPAVRAALPEDGDISYQGTADDKETAIRNMARSFSLAIVILYLLMSALFRSFKDSALVLLALPLATVGGVAMLRLTQLVVDYQQADLMTLIGFITLLGLVVNNAILLVYQTRASERDGLTRRNAVERAVRIRLRPILISTLTSLFGMLPLLLMPGAGTELYRGLAAVIVGGMAVSTVFILILLPSLLRMGEDAPQAQPIGAGGLAGQFSNMPSDRI